MNSDHEIKEEFELYALEPQAWLQSAENLFAAAKILEPNAVKWLMVETEDATLIQPYYMLMGYAIESLFKGLFVIMGLYCIDNSIFKAKFNDNGGHDLLCFDKVFWREPASPEDEWLLKRLSANISWAGRYPIAKNHHKMIGKDFKGEKQPLATYYDYDVHLINAYYESLHKILVKRARRITRVRRITNWIE